MKRDGRTEPVHFDKITARITKLSYGLNTDFCDPVRALEPLRGPWAHVNDSPSVAGALRARTWAPQPCMVAPHGPQFKTGRASGSRPCFAAWVQHQLQHLLA